MARKTTSPVLHLIRRAFEDQRVRDLPDHELLGHFDSGRNAAAFDGLLRRHGPMVLDVCRNVLGNEADAEDAFQATFLILAQKAGTIRKKTSVASWLHGVAYRTALKARAEFAKRQKHEARKAGPLSETASEDITWREVQQVLHAELDRCSERYRAPLVLCYLQGKTQDEAALLLGVSKATLKKHLERGRSLLRSRLVRRGLGPVALLAAAAWPAAKAAACVPPALLSSTVQAATGVAAGHAAASLVSAQVAALTERVLKTMFLSKLRMTAAVAIVLALVPLAGGLVLWLPPEAAQAAAAEGAAAADAPAKKEDSSAKAEDPKKEKDPLQGAWINVDTRPSGFIRLTFLDGRGPTSDSRPLHIRLTPPKDEGAQDGPRGGSGGAPPVGFGGGGGGGAPGGANTGGSGGGVMPPLPGAGRGAFVGYELKERDGKRLLVLKQRGQIDLEVPYRLDGDTLTLDGGSLEVGARAGRPAFLKVELRGQWKRVDAALEDRFHKAFPGMDVDSFAIKLELRGQRLLIAANKLSIQPDGRIRLEDCAFARLPVVKEGAKPGTATTMRSDYALLKLAAAARTLVDLGTSTIHEVEFADGVLMTIKE